MDFELRWGASDNLHSTLHIPTAPELPAGLSPGQAAQLSEIFEFLHLQSRSLVQSASLPEGDFAVQDRPGPMAAALGPAIAIGRVSAQDRRAGNALIAAADASDRSDHFFTRTRIRK